MEKIYRPEINGLRALAVLLVLFYHVDATWVPGGFLGVDIFFVISGYLITRNILIQLQKGQFSLGSFYTRRAKRLLPALGFTIASTLIAGYFLLPSFFYERLSLSSIFSLLSISNFFFWNEGGYFDVGSELKPLLHTWSLGLEEQFYIIWPLLLYGIYKFLPSKKYFVFLSLFLISLAACQFMVFDQPMAVFYLLPFRIFEFALGALCIKIEGITSKRKILSEFFVAIGLGLAIASCFIFDKYTVMPSYLTLIPCLGAMLIIISKGSTLSSLLLENPIAHWIGKTSYSIYLMHWPFIVYYKLWKVGELELLDKGIILTASLITGWILWIAVERRFRMINVRPRVTWISILGFFALIIAGASFINFNQGFPERDQNPYSLNREELTAQKTKYWKDGEPESYLLQGSSEKNLLILGNSHAIDLIYALKYNGFKPGITSLPTNHYCFNFGSLAVQGKDAEKCAETRLKNLSSTAWENADAIYLHDDWKGVNLEDLLLHIQDIRKRSTAPMYIFGPKMVYSRFSDVIIPASGSIVPSEINEFSQQFAMIKYMEGYNDALIKFFDQEYFHNNQIKYIDFLEVQEKYEMVSEKTGKLLYWDSGHLTEDGAIELGQKLKAKHPYLFTL